MSRGALIVLEGIDRTGKSTQSMKLVETLRNMNIAAERMNFPNRSTITGKLINEYLKNKEVQINDQTVHLLFSANRWESFENIKSKLSSGINLIVDRYSHSGLAYSIAKGLDLNWCMQSEEGLPKPDLVLFLDLNPEDLQFRSDFGEDRFDNLQMQRRVSTIFKQFAQSNIDWKAIDASKSIEEVHNLILSHSTKAIQEVQKDITFFATSNKNKTNKTFMKKLKQY